MEWNRFLLKVSYSDGYILYNIENDGIISVNKEKFDSNSFDQDEMSAFLENEFLVNPNTQSDLVIKERLLADWDKSKTLSLVITVTTDCNFKCSYCYEKGITHHSFSHENTLMLCDSLTKYIKENEIVKCNLEITGGEPLLSSSRVEMMLSSLSNLFKSLNISFNLNIVTNGYNLKPDIVDRLLPYNLSWIQITLDGTETIHNKRRPLKNNHGTFDTIIKNLDYIIFQNKLDNITIRINVDAENRVCVPDLLYYLNERYPPERIHLSIGKVSPTVKREGNDNTYNQYLTDIEFAEEYIKLYKLAKELGFTINEFYFDTGFCLSKLKHGFIVEPNGVVSQCFSGVGRDIFALGNITNLPQKKLDLERYDFCLSKGCPFLPKCHTGCYFESLVKEGDKELVSCHRDILEMINSDIIRYLFQNC